MNLESKRPSGRFSVSAEMTTHGRFLTGPMPGQMEPSEIVSTTQMGVYCKITLPWSDEGFRLCRRTSTSISRHSFQGNWYFHTSLDTS